MSDRITQKNVIALLENVRNAAVKAGVVEAANWHLDIGSKTYGRAWRIWLAKEGTTGRYSPAVTDYLGMTAAEAYHTLQAYRSAFYAVIWANES